MDGKPGAATFRNGIERYGDAKADGLPFSPPLLRPVVDLRGTVYRLAGFSCSLKGPSTRGLTSPVQSVEALREAVEMASGADLFVRLDGVAGAAAAAVLPALLNGAEEAGVVLSRLIVDLGGPFPGPIAGNDILETIESTRGRGVRVSMSRAGLSESGLEMLLGTRPDFLRVSAPLVSGCGTDFYRQAIVETISDLAWKFGATVLAEGVMDEIDARWLAGAGVALGQGTHFGEALDREALRARLREPSLPFDASPDPAVQHRPRTTQEEP